MNSWKPTKIQQTVMAIRGACEISGHCARVVHNPVSSFMSEPSIRLVLFRLSNAMTMSLINSAPELRKERD